LRRRPDGTGPRRLEAAEYIGKTGIKDEKEEKSFLHRN
jgi:hypothetical protein